MGPLIVEYKMMKDYYICFDHKTFKYMAYVLKIDLTHILRCYTDRDEPSIKRLMNNHKNWRFWTVLLFWERGVRVALTDFDGFKRKYPKKTELFIFDRLGLH